MDNVTYQQQEAMPTPPASGSASPYLQQQHLDIPPPTAASTETFEHVLEGVISTLRELDGVEHAADKVKALDVVVAAVVKQPRVKYDLNLEEVLPGILTCLADAAPMLIRTAAYRLLRHLIVDQHDVDVLHSHNLPLFLIRSLSRGDKHELEKEHALRLVRFLLELPEAPQAVPSSVVRAVVALAEAQDENLRIASLQTLGELLIRDIELLVAGEGLRVVLHALADGPHDLSPFLANGFLWIVDRPDTRRFLRPGIDIEIVLAGFSEPQGKGSSYDERVKASAKIVSTMLKSWSGLMCLCLHGREAITALVNSIKTPSPTVRETLLDLFFNIFCISRPTWDRGPTLPHVPTAPPTGEGSTARRFNLVDHYLSILLLIFVEAGIVETLLDLSAHVGGTATGNRVSQLLAELSKLSSRVLPMSYSSRVLSMPQLFERIASFDTSDARLAASSTLSVLNEFDRKSARQQLVCVDETRPRSNSLDDPLKRGQRQVESAKIRMGMQIDDATFRNLLLETGVLSTKDHTKWQLPTLFELLEGPLLNPRRLDEAAKASKFMRRLLSFFHPFSYRYSEVPKSYKDSARYTQLACLTLTTLLAHADGVRYLSEDKLLPQIADCLAQLDPMSGLPAPDILLSKHRMDKTLASGYFEMLGVLTRSVDGVRLLEQFKVFTSFYKITELRSRDDLIRFIICNMDYALDGHPRVLLSKMLTSNYKHVRLFATEHIAKLLEATPIAEEWQMRLLLTQLHDPAPEVTALAVHILEKACQSLDTLHIVVQMRPSLDHLGDMGVLLLTRFLSTSVGTRYLYEIDFIAHELDDWYHERNFAYMIQVELLLASTFHSEASLAKVYPFDGNPPPHFYGELAKTPEGCEILSDSGHFPRFADYIQQHGLEDSDAEVIARLKSVLWAVGHIGASVGGLPFLEQEFVIQAIVEIAEDSPVYSLRGTAFFVLGLISSTSEGAEILAELDWQSVFTPLGGPTGVCLPLDIASFVDTPAWQIPTSPVPPTYLLSPPTSHPEREALAALANLSNHILATKASKSLAKLKARHRSLFTSHSLFFRALEMISNYHYRLSVRRYIIELFDISLDDATAREIMLAGDELRPDGSVDEDEREKQRIELALPTAAKAILVDGLDGGLSEDDEDEAPEDAVIMPAQVRKPLLTVKGFFIS